MLNRLLDRISQLCLVIIGCALVVLTVIFGWLVYGRYVLNATPTWVEQVSLLLVALITFLGAAVGVHENSHLSVTWFRDAMPDWIRWLLMVCAHFIMSGFGLLMLVAGYELTLFKWAALIPLINVPEGLRTLPLTVSGGLILLFSLGHLLRLMRFPGVREQGTEQTHKEP